MLAKETPVAVATGKDAQAKSDKAPARSLALMMVLAFATGVIAGVGAWGFRMLIGLVHNVLFLGEAVFTYDANVHTPASPWGWAVVFVPVVGAVVVAWLVKNFAPEAKGHGVPEVMDAIYYNEGRIRPRVAIIKSLASAISIGSGGSVGREGPIVQIGSAFGSTLGQIIPMRTQDRVTLIAAGAGAGIAATFNAPLGGVVFAIELLLVSTNARNLLVVAATIAVATYVSRLLLGIHPSFFVPALETPEFYLEPSLELLAFFALGALMGLLSVVFIRGIYWMEDLFDAMPGNYYTRHMLGMLCTGVMMYLLFRFAGHYYVQGVGYATIMDILVEALRDPWFLLLLLMLKLLATCLSLGSGASGGVFSPALFIGATGGAAFAYLCNVVFPGLHVDVPTFAIAGMAAMIGGTTGAVLTGIIMISEMTQDFSVVLPLVITGSTAYAVRKMIMIESVYTMKLVARGHAVPEGLQAAVLTTKTVRDVMETDFAVVPAAGGHPPGKSIAVLESDGVVAGVTKQPRDAAENSGDASAGLSVHYFIVDEREELLTAMHAMAEAEADILLVSRDARSHKVADVVGIVTSATIVHLLKAQDELL
jgi:CIC family chloride channel protein